MNDEREHIYIRLEAASSLLKMGQKESLPFFEKVLIDSYLANRLECVIILSEISGDESCNLLVKTLLDQHQHPEIRAGAAWSLGELGNKQALDALVTVFNEVEMGIRIEAARALVKLNESSANEVMKFILKSNELQRAGISWSLSKSGNFSISDLLSLMVDDDARKWVAWIIGTQKEERYINQIEELKNKDAEVYFAVTVLWKILSSWVNGIEVY
jgi:HEAT repeat protein